MRVSSDGKHPKPGSGSRAEGFQGGGSKVQGLGF